MENELANIISKIENAYANIKPLEERLKKVDELYERARKKNKKTEGYDLAKKEYKDEIRKIVQNNMPHIEKLEDKRKEVETKKERT